MIKQISTFFPNTDIEHTYKEYVNGKPILSKIYDINGNLIRIENLESGYWKSNEYNDDGYLIYSNDSNGSWVKNERIPNKVIASNSNGEYQITITDKFERMVHISKNNIWYDITYTNDVDGYMVSNNSKNIRKIKYDKDSGEDGQLSITD